jgi:protein phosphatase
MTLSRHRPAATLARSRYESGPVRSRRGGLVWRDGLDRSTDPPRLITVVRRQPGEPVGPTPDWLRQALVSARHLSLPQPLDEFTTDDGPHLVLERPTGRPLRDAWADPGRTDGERFTWLIQLAEALAGLHAAGAVLTGLRPAQVLISPVGQAILADLSGLVPLPPAPTGVIDAGFDAAPELRAGAFDARADLFHCGGLLAALLLGRDLAAEDFSPEGEPVPLAERDPDCHPLLGRLLGRTFRACPDDRFPSAEHAAEGPTGFGELLATLAACREELGRVRLEVGAWTTTGMARAGNEDGFAVVHRTAARHDGAEEWALVLLADGLGGEAAGEVASALALEVMGRHLLADGEGDWPARLAAAIGAANRAVLRAARDGDRPGMGCTAEAVVFDGPRMHVGHVGDSRTYLARAGQAVQLTRDQTPIGRLVELGILTQEQARVHRYRGVLEQALGGGETVEPELCTVALSPGDWVVVCSDGLPDRLDDGDIAAVLSGCGSAEQAARRLINRANLLGAADNVTAVVIRVV